ncbi:MAG: N-acetylmannosamine-6-phosphate 2-epimerase [Lachnospiraceae bacterium]|nr:N-acetylmannosamine-6-phosphate 2-epimerase [Lachnospiraceae bacterium]MDD3660886.1 N-acetylmannosamine-6-phosphate 2-epimerase [Lachnospiraceae bacterium]
MSNRIEDIKGQLIVSCQALEEEPLHSSYIMGKMALAAKEGGAYGIRANSVDDIREIKKVVSLPVIGIIKRVYSDSQIYITPTIAEIDELICVSPEVIAIDATNRMRPGNISLESFYQQIRSKYPTQQLMADCSTVEEAIEADKLGFDYIGTTLVGYTEYSRNFNISDNDFEIIREILGKVKHKVIAEGNIDTPEKAKRVIELGCYSVVVGGAITRPQLITKKFAAAVNSLKE